MDPPSPAPTPMLELEPQLSVPLNANLEFQIHSKDVGEGRNAFLSIFKWTSSPMASPMWSAKSVSPYGSIFEARGKFSRSAGTGLTDKPGIQQVSLFPLLFLSIVIIFVIIWYFKSYFTEEGRACSGAATQKPFSLLRGRENEAFICACACVAVCECVAGGVCMCTFN